MIELGLSIVGIAAAIFLLSVFFGAPFVPTLSVVRDELYELIPVGKSDVVVDLGCGDGSVLLAAARRGARVVGYEINPVLAMIAWLRLKPYGGRVLLANMWRLPALPVGTTVVYYFGAARDISKLQTCLRRWGKGYRLVSFGFEVPGLRLVARQRALHVYKI